MLARRSCFSVRFLCSTFQRFQLFLIDAEARTSLSLQLPVFFLPFLITLSTICYFFAESHWSCCCLVLVNPRAMLIGSLRGAFGLRCVLQKRIIESSTAFRLGSPSQRHILPFQTLVDAQKDSTRRVRAILGGDFALGRHWHLYGLSGPSL